MYLILLAFYVPHGILILMAMMVIIVYAIARPSVVCL